MRKVKKSPRREQVQWNKISDEFLKSLLPLSFEEIRKAIKAKTGIMPSWNALSIQFSVRGISYPRVTLTKNVSPEEKDAFKKAYAAGSFEEVQRSIAKSIPHATSTQIAYVARALGVLGE